jgi:hypothetical protein
MWIEVEILVSDLGVFGTNSGVFGRNRGDFGIETPREALPALGSKVLSYRYPTTTLNTCS